MTRAETIKLINSLPLPAAQKEELIKNLKSQTLTKEEAQTLIKIVDQRLEAIHQEQEATKQEEIAVLRQILAESKAGLDKAYREYEKTMQDMDKKARLLFTQAGDYLDKLQAEQIKNKIMEK